MLQWVPTYEKQHHIILQNAYTTLQQRFENASGLTAEEKYALLVEQNPEFITVYR